MVAQQHFHHRGYNNYSVDQRSDASVWDGLDVAKCKVEEEEPTAQTPKINNILVILYMFFHGLKSSRFVTSNF